MTDYSGESGRKARAENIVDAIHRVHKRAGANVADRIARDGESPEHTLSWDDPDDRAFVRRIFEKNAGGLDGEAVLPGFGPNGEGENAREDCGNPHPFVCAGCGHSVEFGRTCGQSACSRCGVAWCRDAAVKKSAKVRRLRKEKDWHTPDAEHQKIHHQIISPSLGLFADLAKAGYTFREAEDEVQEAVKDILDEMRAQGVAIRHSFRGKNDDGTLHDESDDRGKWKERLNSDREFYGDVRDQLAWMPHFHCIVVSDFLTGGDLTDEVEARTNWVIHRIADDDGVSIPTDGKMVRVLAYSISHADIRVNEDAHNRSQIWEVGSFEGDIFRSSSRFAATPADLEWADQVVRRVAPEILGLRCGSTDCGQTLPAVDDPDELARQILEEIFPKDEGPAREISTDEVLGHVERGNIQVSVSSTSGGGGSVSVSSAFGASVGEDGWHPSGGGFPTVAGGAGATAADGGSEPVVPVVSSENMTRDDEAVDVDCGCGDQDDRECDGTLIPLEEARQRGLLEDEEWCKEAPNVEEARAADRHWDEDLEPWRTEPPGAAIGAG